MATLPSILTPQLPPDQRLLAALGQIKAPGAPPAAYTIPGIQPKPGDQGAELSAPKIASPGIGPAAPPAILNPEPSGGRIGPILSRMNPLHRPPAQPGDALAKMLTPGPLGPPPAPTGTDAITAAKQAENAIQPPNYHGKLGILEKIGDAAGRLFAPGVERSLGIGTLGYQDRLATAQAATDRAEKENATEAQAAANAAKPNEAQAKIDQADAKITETEKNDSAKLAAAYRKLGLDASGAPLPDAQLTPQEIATRDLAQHRAELAQAQAETQQADAALAKARTDALSDPNNPTFKMNLLKAQVAKENADSKVQNLSYAQARTIGEALRLNPQILDALKGQLGLSDAQIAQIKENAPLNPETGEPVGLQNPMAPTTATRTRGQQAQEVLPNFDEAAQQIVSLAPELGPAMGRWNEFMAGKGGFSDPQFSALRTNLDLINGAYSKFHLNTEMGYKNFTDLLNAAQSPANLLANLGVMRQLAERYKEGAAGNIHAGPHGAPAVEMIAPNGQRKLVPADQVDAAIKAGGKKVGQ